jgi:hypothetical protein
MASRLNRIVGHLHASPDGMLQDATFLPNKHFSRDATLRVVGCSAAQQTITVVDNRSGKSYEFPINK